jgi:hypothetical protein
MLSSLSLPRTFRAVQGSSLGRWLRSVVFAVAAIACAMPAVATSAKEKPLTPDDFAYGLEVVVPGEAAAYRASLPLEVYQKLVRADLGDLRVFNERGEIVPYSLERPRSEIVVQGKPTVLPLFTLRGDEKKALELVRMTIESGPSRAEVQLPGASVQVPATGAAAPVGTAGTGKITSYVIDGRALHVPLAAFHLSWPEDAPDFAGRLRVERSDDLGQWRLVVSGAPIANLHAGTARLVERRVDLQSARARYWRLSWDGEPAPFPLTSVTAEPADARVDVERATLVVPGTPVPEHPGEFDFDLGAQLPVDRVNLQLPEQGSIVEVDLFSRATPADEWRPVTRGGIYRLRNTAPSASGERASDLTNGALTIAPNSNRYWRVRIDMRSGGLGSGAPQLQVGWLPHDVVFIARGSGPFTVAYGSAVATAATTPLNAIPQDAVIYRATLESPHPLGGETRRQPKQTSVFFTRSTLLWAVLALGVALLAYMAWRLTRELK